MANFKVNGEDKSLDIEPDMPLLWALRDELGMTGTKFGGGIASCGACTVHINGVAVRSCVTPVSAIEGQEVTTIEGLASAAAGSNPSVATATLTDPALTAVQQAWLLPIGNDHGGVITARAEPQPQRRRYRQQHHQCLSLRLLPPCEACDSLARHRLRGHLDEFFSQTLPPKLRRSWRRRTHWLFGNAP